MISYLFLTHMCMYQGGTMVYMNETVKFFVTAHILNSMGDRKFFSFQP